MLNYIISNRGIKRGQIGTIIIFAILIAFNILFFIFTKTTNALILTLLTILLALVFNFLWSKIYQVHFLNGDILISNIYYKEEKYPKSEFEKITTFLAMAGIYKLNLRSGKNYLFTIDKHIQAKNLFNIDSNKYAKELSKDILERI
jgi:hypothetical protein